MPAWVTISAAFLKNLIPAPLRLLLNPWVLGSVALVLSHGYAFHKGKTHERRSQANAVVDLNQRLAKEESLAAERQVTFDIKLSEEVNKARAEAQNASVDGKCALDEPAIKRTRAVAKTAELP
jgi:hypothetical protein